MATVLVFDQSTKISAHSLWVNGEYVECGVIDLHKIKDTPQRVRAMGVELCNTIKKYTPSYVVIEEVAQQSSPLTLKLLARIQGVIIGFCAANNIETYIIEPSKWRSTLQFKQGPKVKRAELKAIGAGALNQAIKGIAIARGFVAPLGIDLICIPAFDEVIIDGEEKTGIKLIVEARN